MNNVLAVPEQRNTDYIPSKESVAIELIESGLENGEAVTLHTKGVCMSPVLEDSQVIHVRKSAVYFPGDLVAYYCPYQELRFIHRFLGYVWAGGVWNCLFLADNAIRPDTLVGIQNVLGKVVAKDYSNRGISMTQRCNSFFRYCYWVVRLGLGSLQRPLSSRPI
jgi:hypothetical protein